MRFLALIFAVAICAAHAYEGECGTLNALLNSDKIKQNGYAASLYRSGKCSYEQYYDSVYTIEKPHVQVFYVLNGPHATTKAFADSTASNMEAAWNLYVNQLNMRAPQGPQITYHYQQNVKEGLYPIEILDIGQVRDPYGIYSCATCFGQTILLESGTKTEILLENDFYGSATSSNARDTIYSNGDTCIYPIAKHTLNNSTHGFSYADEWAKGIRLTSFHEFYHAVQLRYISSIASNTAFWFEASATGYEEITNPDIDDYFSYLPNVFSEMGIPLSTITKQYTHKAYGVSTLFLYLYHYVAKDIDKAIWENYSKNPNKSFEVQLEAALKKYEIDADSLFHDYAVRLSLSGERSNTISKKDWICDDQDKWVSANFYNVDSIKPQIESLSFMFYRAPNNYVEPDLNNFVGKASIITFTEGKAEFHRIKNSKTLDSLTSVLSTSDSSLWVFSRFGDSESIPLVNNDAAPHAFPVPWREGSLCFAPLPRDKKFIEIRNRRGDLVSQEKYDGTSFCLQEDQVKKMMAPGIYRFRVGNKGKATSFMVIY